MNRDEFAKTVEIQVIKEPDFKITHVQARFVAIRGQRITEVLLKLRPDTIDMVKDDLIRLLYRDIYGKHREKFYKLVNDLKLNLNAPPNSEIYQTLELLKSLVD